MSLKCLELCTLFLNLIFFLTSTLDGAAQRTAMVSLDSTSLPISVRLNNCVDSNTTSGYSVANKVPDEDVNKVQRSRRVQRSENGWQRIRRVMGSHEDGEKRREGREKASKARRLIAKVCYSLSIASFEGAFGVVRMFTLFCFGSVYCG